MPQIYDPVLDQWIESDTGETTQRQGEQATPPADREPPPQDEAPTRPDVPDDDADRHDVEYWDANNQQWYKTGMKFEDKKTNIGGKEVNIPGIKTANETTPMLYRIDGVILEKPDKLRPHEGYENTDYEGNLPAVLPPGYKKKEKKEEKDAPQSKTTGAATIKVGRDTAKPDVIPLTDDLKALRDSKDPEDRRLYQILIGKGITAFNYEVTEFNAREQNRALKWGRMTGPEKFESIKNEPGSGIPNGAKLVDYDKKTGVFTYEVPPVKPKAEEKPESPDPLAGKRYMFTGAYVSNKPKVDESGASDTMTSKVFREQSALINANALDYFENGVKTALQNAKGNIEKYRQSLGDVPYKASEAQKTALANAEANIKRAREFLWRLHDWNEIATNTGDMTGTKQIPIGKRIEFSKNTEKAINDLSNTIQASVSDLYKKSESKSIRGYEQRPAVREYEKQALKNAKDNLNNLKDATTEEYKEWKDKWLEPRKESLQQKAQVFGPAGAGLVISAGAEPTPIGEVLLIIAAGGISAYNAYLAMQGKGESPLTAAIRRIESEKGGVLTAEDLSKISVIPDPGLGKPETIPPSKETFKLTPSPGSLPEGLRKPIIPFPAGGKFRTEIGTSPGSLPAKLEETRQGESRPVAHETGGVSYEEPIGTRNGKPVYSPNPYFSDPYVSDEDKEFILPPALWGNKPKTVSDALDMSPQDVFGATGETATEDDLSIRQVFNYNLIREHSQAEIDELQRLYEKNVQANLEALNAVEIERQAEQMAKDALSPEARAKIARDRAILEKASRESRERYDAAVKADQKAAAAAVAERVKIAQEKLSEKEKEKLLSAIKQKEKRKAEKAQQELQELKKDLKEAESEKEKAKIEAEIRKAQEQYTEASGNYEKADDADTPREISSFVSLYLITSATTLIQASTTASARQAPSLSPSDLLSPAQQGQGVKISQATKTSEQATEQATEQAAQQSQSKTETQIKTTARTSVKSTEQAKTKETERVQSREATREGARENDRTTENEADREMDRERDMLKKQIIPLTRKQDKEARRKIATARGAIAWRQGELNGKDRWDVITNIYRPGQEEYVIVLGKTPQGATIVRGPGSARRTAQYLYGKQPLKQTSVIDQPGLFTTKLDPITGQKVRLSFVRDADITGKSPSISQKSSVFPLAGANNPKNRG